MPRKKPAPTGGAAHLRRRNLKSILLPVRPAVHAALARAAALEDPPASVASWLAALAEKEARRALEEAGLPWPEENPAHS